MLKQLTDQIRAEGHVFVQASAMRGALEQFGSLDDWSAFAKSWNDLGQDTYMADGGRYRKRRHVVFSAGQDGIRRQPAQPHYQSRDYNTLNGGIERWFEPVTQAAASTACMKAILAFCRSLFDRLTPADTWHVEAHQFRIEARHGEAGRPTPEGLHRDGVDHVLVLLISRRNVASGVTSVHDLRGEALGQFTLTEPLDAALVDDQRVTHGVTPVEPVDHAQPAFRDVLVVTFRRM